MLPLLPHVDFIEAVADARAVARTAGPVPKRINRVIGNLLIDKLKKLDKEHALFLYRLRTNQDVKYVQKLDQ